jgi:pimeloyl-ACP methyl ester carboxylesterase
LETLTLLGKQIELRRIKPLIEGVPTLIFLHEGLGCTEMWRDFPDELAAATGFGALIYSRFGYGGSTPAQLPRPLDYMETEALNELPLLLESEEIEECILIGHSDGGTISLVFAGSSPKVKVKGVITLAAHVFCEEISTKAISKAKDDYLRGDLKKKLTRYHGENTDCAFWGWNGAWLDPEFMKWTIERYLPSIVAPLLVIQGRDDEYGTLKQVETIEAKTTFATEVFIVDGCGHWPHVEEKNVVLPVMEKFIRALA